MEPQSKNGWKSDMGYMWSMLGTAIGFANLLGFGSQCYRNGGGAFLIPFFVALFVLGIPMLMLEGVIGQKSQLPLVTAYGRSFGRKGKFFGWLAVSAVTTIGAFYIVLTGWTLAYTYFSASGAIPADTATFFTESFLGMTGSLSDMGSLSLAALFSTLTVSLFAWYVNAQNIQSGIERWCSFFLPILTVLILLFVGIVLLLPGSSEGILLYLKPDFHKILDFTLWRDVFGQLFFSLSLGLGIVVGYSRHTQKTTNIRKAMLTVALADFAISFVAGFVIFGSIGYLAYKEGVPFEDMVKSTSIFEIGYVIFPMIMQTFGELFSRVIGTFFFFSIFIAGITGVFSIAESIAGNIEIEFNKSRKTATTIAMAIMSVLAIPFCFGGGTALIDALEPMVLGNNMLLGGIAQILVFMYLTDEIRNDPVWFSGEKRHIAYYSLKYVSPALLMMSLFFSLKSEADGIYGLSELTRSLWFVLACFISFFLARHKKALELKKA